MYVPNHFKEGDPAVLYECIRDFSFATLVVADENGVEANHLPLYLVSDAGDSPGVLQGHLARDNPVWRRIESGAQVLAIFQGPNAYISPSWYPSKAETGKVVPTWNYLAVHVQGTAKIIQDAGWLLQHLNQLTDLHESNMASPWSVNDAPEDFTRRLCRAIVGLEITIDTLSGKRKASQNQSARNRAGVRAGLTSSGDPLNIDMAHWISDK